MHSQTSAKFPVGHTNIRDIKEKDLVLADKTKLIIDIHDNKNKKIFFISRPACFGKSTILSMLNYFYDHEKNQDGNLFENSIVNKHKEIVEKYQGKFTVINLNFLNLVTDNYSEFLSAWKFDLRNLYSNFSYLEKHLAGSDKEYFNLICRENNSTPADMEMALMKLSQFICDYNKQYKNKGQHHEKPVILIDELDMPLHRGEIIGSFPEIYQHIKNMLTNLVEAPEPVFEMAICTGLYPQTALFSSFKNISVYSSLQDNAFSDAFGFTETEIKAILLQNNIDVEKEYKKILEHYGYYYCGKQILFRDWSVMNAIQGNEIIYQDYFGDRETLINSLMMDLSDTCRNLIKRLLKGHYISSLITDDLYLSRPIHQLTFSILKKDKESFNQKTRYAIFADEKGNWFYRYRDSENINNFTIENINKHENTNLYDFLKTNPLVSKKISSFNISLLDESYNFKTSLIDILIREKGLIHLDEKIWFISLLYAAGFLTSIPFDNKNNSGELIFMIPNREIYNFFMDTLHFNRKEYRYLPRSEILQKINCSSQIANLEFELKKHQNLYFQISKIQYSDKNGRYISIQLLHKHSKSVKKDDLKDILLDLLNAFSTDLELQGVINGEDYDIEDFNAIKGRLKISSKNSSTLEFISLQLEETRQCYLKYYDSNLSLFSKKQEKNMVINNDQHESICVLQ